MSNPMASTAGWRVARRLEWPPRAPRQAPPRPLRHSSAAVERSAPWTCARRSSSRACADRSGGGSRDGERVPGSTHAATRTRRASRPRLSRQFRLLLASAAPGRTECPAPKGRKNVRACRGLVPDACSGVVSDREATTPARGQRCRRAIHSVALAGRALAVAALAIFRAGVVRKNTATPRREGHLVRWPVGLEAIDTGLLIVAGTLR